MPNGNAKNPLLSVVIPCYNVSKFLPTAFEQLKNQTYKNLQIIFVDDGSQDNTKDLLQTFASENQNAVVYSQPNGGVGSARRLGLDNVKGEYFTFYDVDDFLCPSHFENLVNLAVDKGADMAVCSFARKKESKVSKTTLKGKFSDKMEIYDGEQALVQYLTQKKFDFTLWNKIYSTRVLKQTGATFIDCRYGEESYFCYNFLRGCSRVVYNPSKTYFYIQRKSSLMHVKFNESRLDIIKNLQLVKDDSQKNCPRAYPYVSSMRAGYIVGLLFFIKKSDYANSQVIVDLIKMLKQDCKELKACKKTALYRRVFIPLIPLLAKILLKKRIKK